MDWPEWWHVAAVAVCSGAAERVYRRLVRPLARAIVWIESTAPVLLAMAEHFKAEEGRPPVRELLVDLERRFAAVEAEVVGRGSYLHQIRHDLAGRQAASELTARTLARLARRIRRLERAVGA